MRLAISWHPAALVALYGLHWRTAASIDAAVMAFAATGEGRVERIPRRPLLHVLRVGSARVVIQVDPTARTLLVVYLYA